MTKLESWAGEPYDLGNAPEEMQNLFDDAGYAAVRKEMDGLMRAAVEGEGEPD